MVNFEYNKDLYQHNTMRLHCIADMFCEPENLADLSSIIEYLKENKICYKFIGAGSNIVLPNKLRCCVISLMKFNNEISVEGNRVECGASVRIQKLISTLQNYNLGGFEYLHSVPATVGGCIYQNAGRGNKIDSIGNYVEKVVYYDPSSENIYSFTKDSCEFSYRNSVFKNKWGG